MYIYKYYIFQAKICTNDYSSSNLFSAKGDDFVVHCSLARKKYYVDHPWCISSHDELLGV